MKLYLTLDNEKGNKVERVFNLSMDNQENDFNDIVHDMTYTLDTATGEVKLESPCGWYVEGVPMFKGTMEQVDDLVTEGQRLTQHND